MVSIGTNESYTDCGACEKVRDSGSIINFSPIQKMMTIAKQVANTVVASATDWACCSRKPMPLSVPKSSATSAIFQLILRLQNDAMPHFLNH